MIIINHVQGHILKTVHELWVQISQQQVLISHDK